MLKRDATLSAVWRIASGRVIQQFGAVDRVDDQTDNVIHRFGAHKFDRHIARRNRAAGIHKFENHGRILTRRVPDHDRITDNQQAAITHYEYRTAVELESPAVHSIARCESLAIADGLHGGGRIEPYFRTAIELEDDLWASVADVERDFVRQLRHIQIADRQCATYSHEVGPDFSRGSG